MYENRRKHFRVAKRELYENPYEGIYMTREEHQKYFLVSALLILLSFLGSLFIAFKKR